MANTQITLQDVVSNTIQNYSFLLFGRGRVNGKEFADAIKKSYDCNLTPNQMAVFVARKYVKNIQYNGYTITCSTSYVPAVDVTAARTLKDFEAIIKNFVPAFSIGDAVVIAGDGANGARKYALNGVIKDVDFSSRINAYIYTVAASDGKTYVETEGNIIYNE